MILGFRTVGIVFITCMYVTEPWEEVLYDHLACVNSFCILSVILCNAVVVMCPFLNPYWSVSGTALFVNVHTNRNKFIYRYTYAVVLWWEAGVN